MTTATLSRGLHRHSERKRQEWFAAESKLYIPINIYIYIAIMENNWKVLYYSAYAGVNGNYCAKFVEGSRSRWSGVGGFRV